MVDYLANRWFIEKFFQRKLHGLKGTWWKCDLTLSDLVKIGSLMVFLNKNPYFLLHILVVYLESFPKHYNKVTFHWVLSELWSLKVIVPPALSMYACVCERHSYACTSPRSTLLDLRSRARNWVQSFLIERFNFLLFFG